MSDQKIPVMIATPVRHWEGTAEKTFHPHFVHQMDRLSALSEDPECPYEFILSVGEGGLVRTRNEMVKNAKKLGCKFLITWDDDTDATAEHALKLLSHNRPLVGALYTTREENCHWVANFMHEVELQKGGLYQVIEVGTALKCHALAVFKHLENCIPTIAYTDRQTGEKCFGYYQHAVIATDLKPDGDLLSEDYFCDYLCRMAKVGIFVDTTVKIRHRGPDGTLYPKDDRWPPIPGLE